MFMAQANTQARPTQLAGRIDCTKESEQEINPAGTTRSKMASPATVHSP
jgi:hypothetical protein